MYFVWALALIGFFLIFLEFFLPSAIMAIGGGLLLFTSLFFFHMANSSPFAFFVYLSSLLCGTFLVIRIALWKVKASKKEKLSEESQEGFQALIYPKELVGKIGVATTDLKPLGHVWIEDRSFKAVSKIGFIGKGTEVQILSGQGAYLLVKPMNRVDEIPERKSFQGP